MSQPTDPFAALESMMGSVPGGSYLLAMLRNNPDAQEALRSIDPSRPDSMREGMRRLLGVFGMTGPMAEQMLDQAMATMSDPSAMSQMAEQARAAGVQVPPAFAGAPTAAAAPAAAAPATASSTSQPTTAARPPWVGLAVEASRLIAEGSERTAFERMAAALDDPRCEGYDPRAGAWDDLTALLEVYATEAQSAGRQVPLRFAELYRRAALHGGADATAPAANPEFTAWCVRAAGGAA